MRPAASSVGKSLRGQLGPISPRRHVGQLLDGKRSALELEEHFRAMPPNPAIRTLRERGTYFREPSGSRVIVVIDRQK
jgi:hypothetical protein